MVTLLLAIIYISFVSLGLPDCMLGAAWPTMYVEFGVPVSFAGGISLIISLGTIISSLSSDFLTRKLGPGKVTATSVAITALALFGFSISHRYIFLCLWAIPYGLGAGSVDSALNNYVALHYSGRHMSWLHCMWGLGTIIGPTVMGAALSGGMSWNAGYRTISMLQVGITLLLVISLPLWKKVPNVAAGESSINEKAGAVEDNVAVGEKAGAVEEKGSADENIAAVESTSDEKVTVLEENGAAVEPEHITLIEAFHLRGAKQLILMFFCYCALEQTAMLWGSTFLNLHWGIAAEQAATYAGMFCIGITAGRAVNGFLTMKFKDRTLIRLGEGILAVAVLMILLGGNEMISIVGLILVGVGCAPIYPSIIHSTPAYFGANRSQALIGMEMASAYVGACLMPPIFGLLANHISVSLFPVYLLVILVIMVVMFERLEQQTK